MVKPGTTKILLFFNKIMAIARKSTFNCQKKKKKILQCHSFYNSLKMHGQAWHKYTVYTHKNYGNSHENNFQLLKNIKILS